MLPAPIKKLVEVLSLYGLSSSLVLGLALETARVTFENPNPEANFTNAAAAAAGAAGLKRVELDDHGNIGIPYASDVAVDIFTRYVSTPALKQLANLGGDLVDVIDAAGNNTINPLIERLRRFHATNLQGFQTQARALRASTPDHLCLAAVTVVSHVGNNPTLTCPHGDMLSVFDLFS